MATLDTGATQMEASLREQVKKALGSLPDSAPVKKLKGDASNRSYYRVGTPPESTVVMVMPVDSQKRSEEGGANPALGELPFLNVQRYLTRLGVRVPRILRYDEPAGM